MVNADCYGLPHLSILYADQLGMLILFTKLSRFHHGNPQLLRHPFKFAIFDSSATPDSGTKLTIKATGRVFVGVRSKHAFELQNDKKRAY